jgi:hypothetical protein
MQAVRFSRRVGTMPDMFNAKYMFSNAGCSILNVAKIELIILSISLGYFFCTFLQLQINLFCLLLQRADSVCPALGLVRIAPARQCAQAVNLSHILRLAAHRSY